MEMIPRLLGVLETDIIIARLEDIIPLYLRRRTRCVRTGIYVAGDELGLELVHWRYTCIIIVLTDGSFVHLSIYSPV